MGTGKREDLQNTYRCGQCDTDIFFDAGDTKPDSCPECGWKHGSLKKYKIPHNIKLDLGKY